MNSEMIENKFQRQADILYSLGLVNDQQFVFPDDFSEPVQIRPRQQFLNAQVVAIEKNAGQGGFFQDLIDESGFSRLSWAVNNENRRCGFQRI